MRRLAVLLAVIAMLLVAMPAQAQPRFARCMQRASHLDGRAADAYRSFCFMQRHSA